MWLCPHPLCSAASGSSRAQAGNEEGQRSFYLAIGHCFQAAIDLPVHFDRLLTSGSSVGPYSRAFQRSSLGHCVVL